jgi:hypothetical protein
LQANTVDETVCNSGTVRFKRQPLDRRGKLRWDPLYRRLGGPQYQSGRYVDVKCLQIAENWTTVPRLFFQWSIQYTDYPDSELLGVILNVT